MYTVITIVHVLACLFMIGVVLLQQGKGADMGAVFGGSSQTLFGSSGAGNFLTRMTAGVAAVFMVTSLALAYGSARRVTTTIFDDAPLAEPAAPAGEPGAAPAPEGGAPAAEGGAPAPEAAPQAEPQANAGTAEGTGAAGIAVEAKQGEQAVADAIKVGEVKVEGAAAEVKTGAEAAAVKVEEGAKEAAQGAENAAKAVDDKVEDAAAAALGAEAKEAPGQVDPVPPAEIP